MAQQQQSKIGSMKPSPVGRAASNVASFAKLIPKPGAKINAKGMSMCSMENAGQAIAKSAVGKSKSPSPKQKSAIKSSTRKAPTYSQVEKSVRKSMGYK